jgi:hypothetical protein
MMQAGERTMQGDELRAQGREGQLNDAGAPQGDSAGQSSRMVRRHRLAEKKPGEDEEPCRLCRLCV